MVFASCNAIATGTSGVSTFVAPGIISLILFCLVPLAGIKRFIDNKTTKYSQSPLPGQESRYIKDLRGWRDVKDGGRYESWRRSPFTAGYGLLFGNYKSKWKTWFPIWLLIQLMICLWMTQLIPVPAKIQAIVIMALYFMYFVTVLFMRPFISMGSWFIHLAVVFHNGICTVFTQFTDDQGLFNMELAEDVASKGVQGATENDGILIAMGSGGLVTLFVYVVLRIVFKMIGLRSKTEAQIKEDSEEFYSTSARRSSSRSNGLKRMNTNERMLNARNSNWGKTASMNSSSMLAHILGVSDAVDGEKDGENQMQPTRNPMKTNLTSNKNKEQEMTKYLISDTVKQKEQSQSQTVQNNVADALPDGWLEVIHPESGKKYYHNNYTSKTQWTRPTETNGATHASLPDGWQEIRDSSTGKSYFHHSASNKTQWTRPTGP